MGEEPDRKILDFVDKVRTKYNIEKAILFGSRARGDNFKHSDYDIILVSPDFDRVFFTKRIANMYEFWDHYPLDIEPLCYTPDEFEKMKRRIGIVKYAVEEGIVIE
jgi:predicted nucleotidyltransferase